MDHTSTIFCLRLALDLVLLLAIPIILMIVACLYLAEKIPDPDQKDRNIFDNPEQFKVIFIIVQSSIVVISESMIYYFAVLRAKQMINKKKKGGPLRNRKDRPFTTA